MTMCVTSQPSERPGRNFVRLARQDCRGDLITARHRLSKLASVQGDRLQLRESIDRQARAMQYGHGSRPTGLRLPTMPPRVPQLRTSWIAVSLSRGCIGFDDHPRGY